ncbi:hypothetical protein FDENT_6795 [Fusarium denticulatum]|uniref:Uncharacterized protein n=1 Tax=Fusarium denticulatum TaxID=48507 RepID=A0A8H5X6K2_9HYPO|nr:hypothetical protein FDENT_6795 [Fusarium denticulatum]
MLCRQFACLPVKDLNWYKDQFRKVKGSLEDHYRQYYSNNADHVMGKIEAPYTSRVVDFTGLYQQHLRDLVVWVKNNVTPPTPTNYTVVEGRVEVPLSTSARKGIQPVVELFVDDSKRTQVAPGEKKEFHLKFQVLDSVGQIKSFVAQCATAYGVSGALTKAKAS